MNLHILKFNNYYNRIIKRFDTLQEYLPYQIGDTMLNVNFVPNDGVATTQLTNRSYQNLGDYLLVVEDGEILSRWFIMECKRLRNGQYQLTLRRDLVADYYNPILNAPCFIEKATVGNTDPAIFNNENMTFNQIKTSETALKDKTGCAWVVGYVPRDAFKTDTTINSNTIISGSQDITVENLSDWEYYQYSGDNKFNGYYKGYIYYYFGIGLSFKQYNVPVSVFAQCCVRATNTDARLTNYSNIIKWPYNPGFYLTPNLPNDTNNFLPYLDALSMGWLGNASRQFSPIVGAYTNCNSYDETQNFNSLNGKVIYENSTNTYWKVKVNKNEKEISKYITSGSLFNEMRDTLTRTITVNEDPNELNGYQNEQTYNLNGLPNEKSFKISYKYDEYSLSFEQLTISASTTLNNDRYHLDDQPYDMFCIPYSNDLKIYKNGTQILTANKSLAISMAIEIGADAGSGAIYDVQLLPYCPVQYMIKSDGTFDIGNAKVNYIKNGETNIGVILWATTSQFTLDIPYTIEVTDFKVSNECDMYRLCSPNFNGQFEFSAAKNGGVSSFNVDCNYKPFVPYIHVNPNFNRLYGQDFNDARGLVCGGDFSLPQISNAWANYQLNNKNYLNIFNRQIENMEITNKFQNIGSIISGIAGIGSGAAAGAQMGIGSAIAGGALSALGAAADISMEIATQREAIDFKKDLFGYQLGNIQAMPSSLAKTSAFVFNNKIFPILEYYTCTEEERQALKNKIKYNGMTIMRIGKINEFLQTEPTYIKGQLIRLEDTGEDYHFINEVANEINKGVFI